MIMTLRLKVFTLIGAFIRVVFTINVVKRINRDIKKGKLNEDFAFMFECF